MVDGDVAARLLGESSRRRDQVEKSALANRRVGPGMIDFSHHRDGLRGGFVHENGDVRAADKASILQPLLDQLLRFIGGQVGDVNIINQRKINISGAADARLGGEIGHSEHTDFDQIADAQLHIGIGQETGRLRVQRFRAQVRLRRIPRGRCLGQKMEAAQTANDTHHFAIGSGDSALTYQDS